MGCYWRQCGISNHSGKVATLINVATLKTLKTMKRGYLIVSSVILGSFVTFLGMLFWFLYDPSNGETTANGQIVKNVEGKCTDDPINRRLYIDDTLYAKNFGLWTLAHYSGGCSKIIARDYYLNNREGCKYIRPNDIDKAPIKFTVMTCGSVKLTSIIDGKECLDFEKDFN